MRLGGEERGGEVGRSQAACNTARNEASGELSIAAVTLSPHLHGLLQCESVGGAEGGGGEDARENLIKQAGEEPAGE